MPASSSPVAAHALIEINSIESCKHRYYLPNKVATTPRERVVYEEMGLADTAIETIAMGRPQRDVYYAHEELGQRLITMAHGPFTLDCIARNDAEDHALFDTLLQQEGREGFAAAYFRHEGYPEAAQRVEAWWQQRREAEARMEEAAALRSAVQEDEPSERGTDEEALPVGD